MIAISINPNLKELFPDAALGCIAFDVVVEPSNPALRQFASVVIAEIQGEFILETVSERPVIKATKEAYRLLGKDPSRYRPSAEALTRRVVSGKGIYEINNIVDILNLVSLRSGFSIGGYDYNKIVGDIEFGIGRKKEPYEAIGRGELNMENMPLFRDRMGAFGSPTSDSPRTMVTATTTGFLMVIIDFMGSDRFQPAIEESISWMEKHGKAKLAKSWVVR